MVPEDSEGPESPEPRFPDPGRDETRWRPVPRRDDPGVFETRSNHDLYPHTRQHRVGPLPLGCLLLLFIFIVLPMILGLASAIINLLNR
jgi:hypothetical protein